MDSSSQGFKIVLHIFRKCDSIMTTLGRFKHDDGYDNVNVFALGRIDVLCCCS